VNRQSKTIPLILFYVIMGLGVLMILLLLVSTKGLIFPLILSGVALSAVIVVISSIMLPAFTGAQWVPTSTGLVSTILTMSEVKQGELLYDLGSGDGRLVIAAAKDFGARSVGIEIDPFRVIYSRLRIFQLRLADRVKIVRSNFFNIELLDADIVVMFLLQETMNKLQPKLERELTKPNCRVVSILFQFNGWEVIKADNERRIYVYKPRLATQGT
jgi:hypothetical protein